MDVPPKEKVTAKASLSRQSLRRGSDAVEQDLRSPPLSAALRTCGGHRGRRACGRMWTVASRSHAGCVVGTGDEERSVQSFLPPRAPTLRDGVEGFEDIGEDEEDWRDAVGIEAFLEPPRFPSLEEFLAFFSGGGESESEFDLEGELRRFGTAALEIGSILERLPPNPPILRALDAFDADGLSSEDVESGCWLDRGRFRG